MTTAARIASAVVLGPSSASEIPPKEPRTPKEWDAAFHRFFECPPGHPDSDRLRAEFLAIDKKWREQTK